MAFDISNPLGFIGDLVKAHRLNQWAKLCFALSFAFFGGFTFVAGAVLAAATAAVPWWLTGMHAAGTGMMSGVVSAVVTFRRSELSRGMLVALPQGEADKELEGGVQVISK